MVVNIDALNVYQKVKNLYAVDPTQKIHISVLSSSERRFYTPAGDGSRQYWHPVTWRPKLDLTCRRLTIGEFLSMVMFITGIPINPMHRRIKSVGYGVDNKWRGYNARSDNLD